MFKKQREKVKNEQDCNIVIIRSEYGKEFENFSFTEYYDLHGISHEFSSSINPQQNDAVERKNRTS